MKKLSQKNKEAIKSSVLVGVAQMSLMGGVFYLAKATYWLELIPLWFVLGFFGSILTTWYSED